MTMQRDRPRIAVTGARGAAAGWEPKQSYLDAVAAVGGEPFAIQRVEELAQAGGLLLTGGGDVAPERYGREPHPALGGVDRERDAFEIALVSAALDRGLAIFGICRGLQVLVVACGGTLWQDLPSQLPGALNHGRGASRMPGSQRQRHRVLLLPGSLAARAAGRTDFEVNSSHHQAAQTVGERLVASGWAPDGIIEAVEMPGARFALGVQWHAEKAFDQPQNAALFSAFVGAARARKSG